MAPVRELVQPMVAGGLPEAPETKRRLKNLIDVTELSAELDLRGGASATHEDLLRVHTEAYLKQFKELSDAGGGELGLRTPFDPGAYEIAALSAGLVIEAVGSVLSDNHKNAYALSRPPGHHYLPDWPNGFCLFNNIAVAIEAAKAKNLVDRVAVVDWDVHHGNGTEHIFYDRGDVLTISIHQDKCYLPDTGDADKIGGGDGEGTNMNIPLPPGCGHLTYLQAMERLIVPKIREFKADLVIVACGFDASGVDPLSRMLCSAETYRAMTAQLMELTGGKLMAAHEGGYSELHVPFCEHAMLEQMSGSSIRATDPLSYRLGNKQPDEDFQAYQSDRISRLVEHFSL